MQANGATGALRTVISYTAGVEPPLQIASSGAPEMYAAGYTTWGSAIRGAQNVDGLTSSSVTSINVPYASDHIGRNVEPYGSLHAGEPERAYGRVPGRDSLGAAT